MLLLRIYLLAGLLAHKAVWEILKRRQSRAAGQELNSMVSNDRPARRGLPVQAVKAVKIAILLGIAAQTFLPDILPISSEPFVLRIAGTLIYTAGLLIAIRGRTHLGTNWSDIEASRVFNEHEIVSNGPYRFIRHPIYIGDLLLMFGLELALNSWLILGVLFLAPVVLGLAIREEKKLMLTLPGYQRYCSKTKRFIPFVV
jgi:protein-S-isoprenylcysteine O-methyltransferase Ste14